MEIACASDENMDSPHLNIKELVMSLIRHAFVSHSVFPSSTHATVDSRLFKEEAQPSNTRGRLESV